MLLNDVIKTLKVNHYLKNIVVFLPIIFSMNLTNINLLGKEVLMFVSFCLISSAVYVLNDLIDIEKDRLHPVKSRRPIAVGRVSKLQAILLFWGLFFLSTGLSLKLNLYCFGAVLLYLFLNVLYSLRLKYLELVDVVCIALGFILRVLAGCAAIWVVPSALIVLLTFFMSMFFTFSKRKLELKLLKESARNSVKNLSESLLNQYIIINAILSVAFYFTYVLDDKTIARAGTQYLWITVIPFALLFFRLLYLTNIETENDDPMHFIENDLQIKLLMGIFFVLLLGLII